MEIQCEHGVIVYDTCSHCRPESGLTFAKFSVANRTRCEDPRGFNESLGADGDTLLSDWVLNMTEELGEIAKAVLGYTGKKARKAHLGVADIGKELADLVTYADLVAQKLGLDLGTLVAQKFNEVSDRIGHPLKLQLPTKDAPTNLCRVCFGIGSVSRLSVLQMCDDCGGVGYYAT